MVDAHKNFAYSTIATAPSPAASGTSLVVAAGEGALFPAVPFNATIWPTSAQPLATNAEIVRVTNITTDTLTITRTQEGTSARTIIVGDQIAATITNLTLTDIEGLIHKVSHIIPFVGLAENAAVEVLLPRPGVCVGESGEHGTFTAIRGKAICGTAGTGTNTILIEADDNPAFSTPTVLYTLNLGTTTEVDDTTLDNAWASTDIFLRARMTAVGATAPKDLLVEFFFSEGAY